MTTLVPVVYLSSEDKAIWSHHLGPLLLRVTSDVHKLLVHGF
jgi:hypothetical protein